MDLCEKVEQALESVLKVEEAILHDEDGLIGYVVSPDFNGQDSYSRQAVIYDALRGPDSRLSPDEVQRVVALVAFTPEEYAVHGPEMHRSL
jgi:acid stress-induced BolA-like protein IbaG/YrbA